MNRVAIAFALLALACEPDPPPASIEPWEPIDAAFAGCQGACGAHAEGPDEDVSVQPGVSIGDRTYCPVSGAVFEVNAEHPHADVNGDRFYFCCAGCLTYFEEHRERVLRTRGLQI